MLISDGSEFIKENPDLVSPDNAMAFLFDDGGKTFNRCTCEPQLSMQRFLNPDANGKNRSSTQSGAALRSEIWTCGVARRTRSSLSILIEMEGFTTRCVYNYGIR